MLEFVIAGLALGGIYAIASAGLVITYTSSGILNFAFGAMAFFIARLYYYLHTQQNWSIATAAIVSIGIAAPLMGIFLYAILFRFLRFRSPLIKVVATIGLLVAIPGIATVIFGTRGNPPGARARSRARARLPVPRRSRDARPDHRLHLRRGDRGHRCPRPALHGGRTQGEGHGRLAGHDGPLGDEPRAGVRRRVGRQRLLRRLDGSPGRPRHRPRRGTVHPPRRGGVRRRHRGEDAQPADRRGGRAAHGHRHFAGPALPPVEQSMDGRGHRRHPVHRHRPGVALQPRAAWTRR